MGAKVVKITIEGVFQGDVDNGIGNTWWYAPETVDPDPTILAPELSELLDFFATNVWEQVQGLLSDQYEVVRMQADLYDFDLPDPSITDIFAIKTSFIQPLGLRSGVVSNIISAASFIRTRTSRVTRSGGLRIGPLPKDDWTNNGPDTPLIDTLILNIVNASTISIITTGFDYTTVIVGFPNDNRPTIVAQASPALLFQRLTSQGSRLD